MLLDAIFLLEVYRDALGPDFVKELFELAEDSGIDLAVLMEDEDD